MTDDYLDVDPPTADPLRLARHALDMGNGRRALEHLADAGSSDATITQSPEFWHLRGQAYLALDRNDDAREAAERGLAIAPNDVDLLLTVATAQAWLGDVAAAERSLLHAIERVPGSPGLLATYARVLLMAGYVERARELAERALSIDPHGEFPWTARLEVAYLARERDFAQLVQAALQTNPRHQLANVLHGELRERRGDYETSARVWSELARDDPGEEVLAVEARRRRGLLHWSMRPARFISRWPWLTVAAYVTAAVVLRIPGVVLLFVYLQLAPLWAERWMRRRARRRREGRNR